MPRKLYPAKRGLLWLSLLAVLICFDVPAGAAGDSDASHGEVEEILDAPFESVTGADVFEPRGLTGTWGGARTWLFDRGIELSMDVTQGVQGVLEGGGDEEADYLGSSELILDVDSEKLGLWPGGFARVAVEGRFGSDVLSEAGTFSPVSNDAVFPSDPDRPGKDLVALTELTATQFFAPWIGIFGGLVNTTSGDANDYAGFLRSNEHFQNISFLGSLASFRVVPSVTLGGGFVVIPFDWLVGSLTFMSTEESAGSDPFETDDGGTFVTEWKVSHDLLKLPVRHVAAFAIGFDNDFFRLGKLPQLELPPDQGPQLRFATKDESWAVWYNGQLDFWNHAEDEERKAGLFFRFGYADDETSFVEWNLAAGIGGTGVFDFRPRDRFGIGIYHIEPSSEYPLPEFGVNEETGFEIFYNAEIWSGVNLTADLQYIDSAFGNGPLVTSTPDNAWVGGLRLRIVL